MPSEIGVETSETDVGSSEIVVAVSFADAKFGTSNAVIGKALIKDKEPFLGHFGCRLVKQRQTVPGHPDRSSAMDTSHSRRGKISNTALA